jgi:hypothetical protein
MSGSDNTSAGGELDARLNEAFRRLPDTDDLRDLKDELRASLAARVAELEASGAGPMAAVSTAFAELGDIEQLAAEVAGEPAGPAGGEPVRGTAFAGDAAARMSAADTKAGGADAATGRSTFELVQRHRVRPRPAFVVRTVLLSVVAAAGLALTVLAALGILGWPIGASAVAAIVLLAAPIGVIVGDGTHQETTTNYPVPGRRAIGYGASAFLGLAGLALGALYATHLAQLWLIVVAAPLVVVSIAWFSYLGATQTNRKKPWMARLRSVYTNEFDGGDRFSKDPAAAARFGIYTVVIMVVSVAVFVILSLTVGFVWSWLALVAGFVVFFLVLARMLFPAGRNESNGAHHE